MTNQIKNVTKKTILIVEDSKMFARVLSMGISSDTNFNVVVAGNYAEAVKLIESGDYSFFASLLDLNLPDAPNGEVIDFVLSNGIPSIVFTGKFDDDLRDRMLSKGIVDYVLKEGPSNIDYVVSLIKQLDRNASIKVMIVDDSKTARKHVTKLLKIYRFIVFEAVNGEQALTVLNSNKDIELIITDLNMPKMDGFELTKRIRQFYNKRDLAIIGMSSYGNNLLSARFLKFGGSDFITKPFLEEEFFCRVNQNIELLEYIKELKFIATRDYLTGLYNRRHFFEVGDKLFNRACKSQKNLAVGLIDIDYFKRVNDTYGHDVGDIVLKRIGELLSSSFRAGDLVARLGGEEFCFLLPDVSPQESGAIFENLRKKIEQDIIYLHDDTTLKITASMGVCTSFEKDLESALSTADKLLYEAKNNGRNQVILN